MSGMGRGWLQGEESSPSKHESCRDPQGCRDGLCESEEMMSQLTKLLIAKEAIDEAIAFHDRAAGAVDFRDAVELLLVGTPFEKPLKHDVEGLYGRVRAAIQLHQRRSDG